MRLVRRLIGNSSLQGLRLDHIDGLRDPHQYFRRLQRLIDTERPPGDEPFYVIVEKILADGERLPRFAGVAGTTGYEWLNVISRVLLDDRGLGALERAWREASGDERAFDAILIEAKRRVIENILASEFTVLVRLLARIAAGHYATRDYPADRLRRAFELFILHFPIYRTYVTPSGPSREDRAVIDAALAKARADWFGPDSAIFDFLRDALTLDLVSPGRTGHSIARDRRFAFKVQQFTGPMMAKSLEDTAFYRYHRLLALNEVGGNPAAGGLSVGAFHQRMRERAAKSPHGLTTTATHDTKRGEDARARLIALSELRRGVGAQAWRTGASSTPHWRSRPGRCEFRRRRTNTCCISPCSAPGLWPDATKASSNECRPTRSRPPARASSRRAGSRPTKITRAGFGTLCIACSRIARRDSSTRSTHSRVERR